MRISRTAALQFSLRIISAIIGTIALIYFANVLGSEKIGIYTLGITVTVWLWLVSDFGIPSALIKRVSEGEEEAEFFTSALVLSIVLILAVVGPLFLFAESVNAYVGIPAATFIAALVISRRLFAITTSTISGHDRVATSSTVKFIERTLRSAIQIVAVLLGLGVIGLWLGYAASLAIGSIIGLILLPTSLAIPSKKHFRRLFSFAKFAVFKMVRSRAARWTDTAVLGFFVSTSLVGVYEIAWSVALLLILASDSLISSLFPKMSSFASQGQTELVSNLTEQGVLFSGVIVIPGLIGAVLLGDDLLRLFGPEFAKGVAVLPILLIWSLIVSYEHIHRITMDAMDRPDLTFRADLAYVVANLVGNVTLVYYYGWIGAAVATSGAAILSLIVSIMYTNQLVEIEYPLKELSKQLAAGLIMVPVVFCVGSYTESLPRGFVLVPVALGGLTYFSVLFYLSPNIRTRVREIVPS